MRPKRSRLIFLAPLLLVAACAGFHPRPLESSSFRDRALTQEREGLIVRVAVPTIAEAKQIFGVDLARQYIQPVWLEIQNQTGEQFYFMSHGLDPDYFSAHEAAYMSHLRLRPTTNERMDAYFSELGLAPLIETGRKQTGFVFTNLKQGTKAVRVRLIGDRRVEDFRFTVQVPGLRADWQQVDFEALYTEEQITDLRTEAELYEFISGLPCCTKRGDGSGEGDPINIVVIDSDSHAGLQAFVLAGWDETELLTGSSALKTFRAFFGGEYKHSPMSALYLFGRPQDVSLQKARDSIHQRNHLRLWLSPYRFRGKDIWAGTITRDIGVYFTTRAWNLTTHAIDPNVDEARGYLTENLATARTLARLGFAPGVGAATRADPHRNLMYAPWYTDGERDVYELADELVELDELQFFDW